MTAVLVSVFAIYFGAHPDGAMLGAAVLLVCLFRKNRFAALAVANVLVLVLSGMGPRQRTSGEDLLIDTSLALGTHPTLLIVKIAAIAGLVLISMATLYLMKRRPSANPFLCNLGLLSAVIALYYLIPWPPLPSAILHGAAVYFAQFFWFLTYSQVAMIRTGGWAWRSLAAMPFWNSISTWHIGASPRGIGELAACEVTESRTLFLVRVKACAMIVGGLILMNYFEIFKRSVFSSMGLPSVTLMGLHRFVGFEINFFAYWFISFLETALFLTQNTAVLCVLIGLPRLAGFNIPFAIQSPWQSRNYAEFLRRVYYYYSETIMYFFPPLFRKISRRPAVIASLSLLAGGYIAHLIEEIPYGLDASAMFLSNSLRILPYLSLILAGLFLTARIRTPAGAKLPVKILFMVFYFSLYSVAYNSLIYFKEGYLLFKSPGTFAEYLIFMGRFLGL